MATVIDKLRVQGGPVPNSPATFTRASVTRSSNRRQTAMKDRGNPSKDASHSAPNFGPTPIAKRMEYFTRIRQANIGLSSMDFPNVNNETDSTLKLDLVLTGKSVAPTEEEIVDMNIGVPDQRWAKPTRAGRYKTTPRDLYRVSHGISSSKTGSEPSPFGHGIHAVFEPENSNGQRLGNGDSSYTRSQVDGHDNLSLPSISAGTPAFSNGLPSTAPSSDTRTTGSLRSATMTSLELTGQRFSGMPSDEFCGYVGADVLDESNFPYLRSPRRRLKYSRPGNQYITWSDDVEKSQELQNCLKIRKTNLPFPEKVRSHHGESKPGDIDAKLRQHDSVPHSGPADKDLKKYEFSTVDSYLNFNRHFKPVVQHGRFAQLPRGVVTMPGPWADEVLLRMVYDMNNPKSRKSSAKYSDIAVHSDLDEFFVVRTPSVSDKYGNTGSNIVVSSAHRSPVLGRKSNKSVISARTEDKIEEEEEDGETNMQEETAVHVNGNEDPFTHERAQGYQDDSLSVEYSKQNPECIPETTNGDHAIQGQLDSSTFDPESISVINDKMDDLAEISDTTDKSEAIGQVHLDNIHKDGVKENGETTG